MTVVEPHDARTWCVSLTPLGAKTRLAAEQQMDRIIDQLRVEPSLLANAEVALKTVRNQLPQLSQELPPPKK